MTSILARNPHAAGCPVCGEGGEARRRLELLASSAGTQSSDRERNLRALASADWYERARGLIGNRTVCHGCASQLEYLCREYDTARAFAGAARSLNPDEASIQNLMGHFPAGREPPGDWLKRVRIMAMPDRNPIEPATTLVSTKR